MSVGQVSRRWARTAARAVILASVLALAAAACGSGGSGGDGASEASAASSSLKDTAGHLAIAASPEVETLETPPQEAASTGSTQAGSAVELSATPISEPELPLVGRVVVVDPGHQLGNARFPTQVNASVDAGFGKSKACNTTGTATNDGVDEATVNWEVASLLAADLEALGAEVILTRTSNSEEEWGPCIDLRGSLGNGSADALVSIHADGMGSADYGFHVLLPGTDQGIYPESLRLGEEVRAALDAAEIPRATYIRDAMRASNDYGTLNLSTKPAVILEMGNMRNADDAARLVDPEGQAAYAAALAAAVESFLTSPE